MKLRIRTTDLHLRHTFTISRGSKDTVRTVIVEVESDGIVGYGEASPSAYYGHTPESVAASLERARPILERADPLRWRALIADLAPLGDRAAIAALDIAIHDWAGKRLGLPLHRILGLDPTRMPPSSFTIGIDTTERMVEKAREAAGFPILKVKLGTSRDLEIVGALRKATGATIRVDANGAWTPAEAVERSKALRDLGVEFIEQPLPADSIEAMAEVRQASALPLYADESAVTARDVPALAGRFDGIVVKLVKCGGILGALRMMEVARAVDLKIMIGCMIESSISISAAAQIGPLADHLDLDGAILIANDPFEGAANEHGTMVLPEGAGLGVRPRREPPRQI